MKYLCSQLSEMKKVKEIYISRNKLSPVGFNQLSECLKFFPNLEILCCSINPIVDDGSANPSWTEWFRGIPIGLRVFCENLHFISKLKQLGMKCIYLLIFFILLNSM